MSEEEQKPSGPPPQTEAQAAPSAAGKPEAAPPKAPKAEAAKLEAKKPETAKGEAPKAGGGKPAAKPEGGKPPARPAGRKGEPKAAAPGAVGEHLKPKRVRLREKYGQEIVPALMERLGIRNRLAVPRLEKICLNMGFGKAATENNPKLMEQCLTDMAQITGQKAVVTLARKSISNFKLRGGMKIGCRVTLRGARMYEFLDRLVSVAIPRIRDFRGLSPRAFDGHGNYSLGLQEQTVFPEIDADRADVVHGMDVTLCTSARDDKQALELLRALGMPFRER